jgi:hypothetical protein
LAGLNEIKEEDFADFIDKCVNSKDGYDSVAGVIMKNLSTLEDEKEYKIDIDAFVDRLPTGTIRHDFDIRGTANMIDGKRVGMFIMLNTSKFPDKYVDFKVLRRDNVAKTQVECDISSTGSVNIQTMAKAMEAINNISEKFDQNVELLFSQNKLYDRLKQLSEGLSTVSISKTSQAMVFVQDHVRWLSQMVHVVGLVDQTVMFYRDAFNAIVKDYEAEAKKKA